MTQLYRYLPGLFSLHFEGFPAGYCYPGDPNVFAQDLLQYVQILPNASATAYYCIGSDIPGPSYHGMAWLRTNSGDKDGWYYWLETVGAWVRPHPIPPLSKERKIWVGTLTELQTYDYGDTNAVGPASGPFWEVDSAFEAKFPVGVGQFASAGAVNVTETTTSTGLTGEDKHVLTAQEMPLHTHGYFDPRIGAGEGIQGDADPNWVMYKHPTNENCTGTSCPAGENQPHNNLPPFYGVYFIKRTARIYYKA